jgi:hypothetical protein
MADDRLVVPGDGLRGVWVGRADADEVLAVFGTDADLYRYTTTGEVYVINYENDARGRYLPTRPGQASRPARFELEFGLVKAIDIGVYQTDLYTTGGVRIGSPEPDVVRVFGAPDARWRSESLETMLYRDRGIALTITEDRTVSGFDIFRARR